MSKWSVCDAILTDDGLKYYSLTHHYTLSVLKFWISKKVYFTVNNFTNCFKNIY